MASNEFQQKENFPETISQKKNLNEKKFDKRFGYKNRV